MPFIGKVGVLDIASRMIKFINTSDIWELHFRYVLGPILSIGDNELRLGSKARGDFDVVGVMAVGMMNRQPGFTFATAKIMSGNHDHRNADRQSLINRGQMESLGAAAGFSRAGDAFVC